MSNRPIYLLSGLGADERLFSRLVINSNNLHPVKWIVPEKKESLKHYAGRLLEIMDPEEPPILIGCSMGGILASEIADHTEVHKTLIISSIKKRKELPPYLRPFKHIPLYKPFPIKSLTMMGRMVRPVFGNFNKEDHQLFNEMVSDTPGSFIKWAMEQVLYWDKEESNKSIIHVHGDKDLLFPRRYIQGDCIWVEGGTHGMIINKPKEISSIINKFLKDDKEVENPEYKKNH